MTVLVTRPKPQGEVLCQRIREAGYEAIYFPTIEITSLNKGFPLEIEEYDWLIFISPQAVYHAILPSKLPNIAAVGLSTASALKERNIPVTLYPKEEWSSEGLLRLPEFQQVVGKKILIIKGEEGREILAKTLESRGARVSDQIVYRRVLPKNDPTPIRLLLREHKIDIIVCTSTTGIQNLLQLLGDEQSSFLFPIPLLVVSERLKEYATELGFHIVKLAKNASHESILEVLKKDTL